MNKNGERLRDQSPKQDRVTRAVELYGLIHHHESQVPSWDCELHRLLAAMTPSENERYYKGINRMYRQVSDAAIADYNRMMATAPAAVELEPELPMVPDPDVVQLATVDVRQDEEDPFADLR